MTKAVDILGAGASLALYKHNGNDVFVPYEHKYLAKDYSGEVITFGMHDYMPDEKNAKVTFDNFPFAQMKEEKMPFYITCTAAYCLIYAILCGYESINLYGIDMSGQEEYINQRPCILHWVGYARAKGVTVYNSSMIDDRPLYGKRDNLVMLRKLRMIKDKVLKDTPKSDAHKQQITGFVFACETMERELI